MGFLISSAMMFGDVCAINSSIKFYESAIYGKSRDQT